MRRSYGRCVSRHSRSIKFAVIRTVTDDLTGGKRARMTAGSEAAIHAALAPTAGVSRVLSLAQLDSRLRRSSHGATVGQDRPVEGSGRLPAIERWRAVLVPFGTNG